MHVLKIEQFGEDLGMSFPPELLREIGAGEGDHLLVERTPSGWVLRRCDADTARQLELARDAADRYRGVLGQLAKS